jgi:hypothetical protein
MPSVHPSLNVCMLLRQDLVQHRPFKHNSKMKSAVAATLVLLLAASTQGMCPARPRSEAAGVCLHVYPILLLSERPFEHHALWPASQPGTHVWYLQC